MSEGSSQLLTQPFLPSDTSTYSDGHTIIGCGLTQAKKDAANKPRFVDFACSHPEVSVRYLKISRLLSSVTGQSICCFGHRRGHPELTLGREGKL